MKLHDINGVPLLHVDGEGITEVSLTFLAGGSDEVFAKAGVAHLVEHLVMHEVGKTNYPSNATVDLELTRFFARGRAAATADFLAKVCTGIQIVALGATSAGDLDREARVLSAEHGDKGSAAALPLLELFGLQGPGLGAVPPPALADLTNDDAAAWARTLLVARNAVLTVRGPLPDDLRVTLAQGARNRRRLPAPVGQLEPTPMQRHESGADVTIAGMLAPAGLLTGQTARVVQRLLTDRLRLDLGHSYSVEAVRTRLDQETDYVCFLVDSAPGAERRVAISLLRELRRIAQGGVRQADIETDVDEFDEFLHHPEWHDVWLYGGALRVLWDDPLESAEELRELFASTPAESVAGRLAEGLRTLHLIVPLDEPLTAAECDGTPLAVAPECVGQPIRGRTLKAPLFSRGVPRGLYLVYNDEAMALRTPEDAWHVVTYGEVVGLGRWGKERAVVGLKGCRIPVDPAAFRGAEQLVAHLDRVVDPSRAFRLQSPLAEWF